MICCDSHIYFNEYTVIRYAKKGKEKGKQEVRKGGRKVGEGEEERKEKEKERAGFLLKRFLFGRLNGELV